MNKRNAKTLGISLALMLVMCVATALLSFSLADDTTPPEDGKTLVADAAASFSTTKTNIDYIIQNSNEAGTDESGRDLSKFYIVEIGSASSDANSPLKKMLTEDFSTDTSTDDISHFVKQVINGWSTVEGATMAPNKISYQYFSVGSLTTEDTIQAAMTAVGKADLIYVSNDPSAKYSKTNDIPEDLKILLSTAATSTYTPFIIDSPTKTQNGNGGGSSSKTVTNLVQNVLVKAGYYRNAFGYDTTKSSNVSAFLNRTDKNSLWLPITGSAKESNWLRDADGKTTARVLTISKAGNSTITDTIKGAVDPTKTYDANALITDEAYDLNADKFELTGTDAEKRAAYNALFADKTGYLLEGTTFGNYGYSVSSICPDNIFFETLKCGSDGKLNLDGVNLGGYDLVIMEDDLSDVVLTADQYNTFYSMVYGLQHILYNASMAGSATGGEGGTTIVTSEAANYTYVMQKVADSNEKARFSNVLVTGMSEMIIYGAATAPSGVKAIVDIINDGSYRGSGGGGSSSNLYTVLEIQPCYPIDLNLAKALKDAGFSNSGMGNQTDNTNLFYYIEGASVLNNVTSDQISFDGGVTSLSDMEATDDATTGISSRGAVQNSSLITKANAVDYYAWELSKAKVAHLTGLNYNQVNVVHMSSTEFNTSRETLMDNYDAIYIGGNNSAIRDINYLLTGYFTAGRTSSNATMYNMYFHQGGTYNQTTATTGIGVLTGNDITYNKLEELTSYVRAGMPVIFTKAVTEAYYGAALNGYNQTLMDPGSNIFTFMSRCLDGTASVVEDGNLKYPTKQANVLAGFDPTDQVKIPNSGGEYGDTYSGYATVFGGIDTNVYVYQLTGPAGDQFYANLLTTVTPSTYQVNAEEFSALLRSTSVGQRPKFSLIQSPAVYIEGDKSTEIAKGSTITFKYDVASRQTYTVRVYVDDNTNSRFEDTEILYQGKANPIKITLPSSFDGGMYWKFEITAGACKGSTTGLSKVSVPPTDKNYVNVLQIVNDKAATITEAAGNYTSIFFCTECQQAKGLLKGNRFFNTGKYSISAAWGEPYGDTNHSPESVTVALANPATYDTGYTNIAANKDLGIHRHNFGVVKYDSNYTLGGKTGIDNWETNWAEDLYDEYDMDIDIWTTRDFEAAVEDARAHVNASNHDDVVGYYQSLASIYNNYYMTMKSLIDGTVKTTDPNYTYLVNKLTSNADMFVEADLNMLFGEEAGAYALETAKGGFHVSMEELNNYRTAQTNMDNLLKSAQGSIETDKTSKTQMSQEIDYETTYHRYSDFYSLSTNRSTSFTASYNKATVATDGTITTSPATGVSSNFYTEFGKYYGYWRNAKIYEQYFYKMYQKYLVYATMKEFNGEYLPDYNEVFSCVVIGAAEFFGYDDLNKNSNYALDTIKQYILNEGNTFIFHNTINDGSASSTSTVNMTRELKKLFGQDYSHLTNRTVKESAIRYEITGVKRESYNDPDVLASGTLQTGEGLTISAAFINQDNNSNSKLDKLVATTNTTGNAVVSWNVKDKNGNPQGTYYAAEKVYIYINGELKATVGPPTDNSASSGTETVNWGTLTPQEITKIVSESDDPDRYFVTPLLKNGGSIRLSPDHLTWWNEGALGNTSWTNTNMYKQATTLRSIAYTSDPWKKNDPDARGIDIYTNRASQTNRSKVTMYPFMISSELKISGTHPNSFSVDIEDDDLVVYYTLAGGLSSDKTHSTATAANPHDGIDQYFLYSYGNVTYCGAGHSAMTGIGRDNNDERRLFINVILNSVKKSVFGPTIQVFDPDPVTNPVTGESEYVNNTITPTEEGIYEMTVPNVLTIPEFTYRVSIQDQSEEVEHVKIYYDLSANTNGDNYGYLAGTDVMIFEADASNDTSILKNQYKKIGSSIAALQLQDSYFEPYDNKFTYIVIAVKTTKGTYVTQRIMVKLAPKLWDLT